MTKKQQLDNNVVVVHLTVWYCKLFLIFLLSNLLKQLTKCSKHFSELALNIEFYCFFDKKLKLLSTKSSVWLFGQIVLVLVSYWMAACVQTFTFRTWKDVKIVLFCYTETLIQYLHYCNKFKQYPALLKIFWQQDVFKFLVIHRMLLFSGVVMMRTSSPFQGCMYTVHILLYDHYYRSRMTVMLTLTSILKEI